jgi:hypothetical protein
MTNPNNWPDPAKPGVPLNPERDGWHWLQSERGRGLAPKEWRAGETRRWCMSNGELCADWQIAERYTYLGPCLTPAEVAARERAARREGREEAARIFDEHAGDLEAWAASHPEMAEAEPEYWAEQHRQYEQHLRYAASIRAAAKEVG